MNALRRIHAALVPGGLLVDTQPVSADPPVESDRGRIGTLDMSAWALSIATIDERIQQAIAAGLFAVEHERRLVVTDEYDDGEEFVAVTGEWAGTRVDDELAASARRERGPVRLHQDVRLRVLRARGGS